MYHLFLKHYVRQISRAFNLIAKYYFRKGNTILILQMWNQKSREIE